MTRLYIGTRIDYHRNHGPEKRAKQGTGSTSRPSLPTAWTRGVRLPIEFVWGKPRTLQEQPRTDLARNPEVRSDQPV